MLQNCELFYLSTYVPNSDLLQEFTVNQGALFLPSPVSLFLCVLSRNWKHLSVIHRCSLQNARNVVWTAGFIFLEITPRFFFSPNSLLAIETEFIVFTILFHWSTEWDLSSSFNWNLLVVFGFWPWICINYWQSFKIFDSYLKKR